MKIKPLFTRYGFLLRLIAMSCMVISVAILLSIVLVAREAQSQMESNNREYRLGTAHTFADYYNEQLMQLLGNALNIQYDAKLNRQTVEKHVYNQIEAIGALKKRRAGSLIAGEMCIYYPGADYVITSIGKYNLDFFTDQYVATKNPSLSEAVRQFITKDHDKRIEYFSTFGRVAESEAKLIVSAKSSVGATQSHSDARVFYIITYDSLSTSFMNAIGADNCALAILNQDGTAICWSELMQGRAAALTMALIEQGSYEYMDGGAMYNAYLWKDSRNGLSFVTVLPSAVVAQQLIAYSRTMQMTIWISIALLILTTGISVWVSYTPVRSVVSRMRHMAPGGQANGELQSIIDMIDQFGTQSEEMSTLLGERRMASMDRIMNNLLNGMPISSEMFGQIGVDLSGRMLYCISAAGLNQLDNASREALMNQLKKRSGAELFMLDPLEQEHMILVCGLGANEDIKAFVDLAQLIFQQYADGPVRLGIGNGVDEVNDLHLSYMNSVSALREGGGLTYYADLVKSYSTLEFYPTSEMLRFIRHVESAKAAEAMLVLDDIQSYIARSIKSIIHERYICYNIVGTLLRLAEKLDVPIPKEDIDRLLLFTGFGDLRQPLNAATLFICGKIRRRKEDADAQSRSSLVTYVDEHFSDGDLSLISMADVFGMSIYTLSRVFKEAAGMGFKEYVTGRRMKRAKELLATELEIKEIAARVGQLKPEYFTKMFKSYYGISPSELRKDTTLNELASGNKE